MSQNNLKRMCSLLRLFKKNIQKYTDKLTFVKVKFSILQDFYEIPKDV